MTQFSQSVYQNIFIFIDLLAAFFLSKAEAAESLSNHINKLAAIYIDPVVFIFAYSVNLFMAKINTANYL